VALVLILVAVAVFAVGSVLWFGIASSGSTATTATTTQGVSSQTTQTVTTAQQTGSSMGDLCAYYHAYYGVSYCPYGPMSLLSFVVIDFFSIPVALEVWAIALAVVGVTVFLVSRRKRKRARKK